MGDLYFEDLDGRLLDGQVGHLDVEPMEVNALNRLVYSLSQLSFTDEWHSVGVRHSARLVEFSEETVEIVGGVVLHEPGPVSVDGPLGFVGVNDLRIVPREGEHICVLLFGELLVGTDPGPFFLDGANLGVGLL